MLVIEDEVRDVLKGVVLRQVVQFLGVEFDVVMSHNSWTLWSVAKNKNKINCID